MDKKIFIGARSLELNEVEMILPTFGSLLKQIEEIRIVAKNDSSSSVCRDKNYNNNFSILGERGTGKSSCIKTIIDYIKNENKKNGVEDIILPIIEPDIYGDSTKVMGMILGLLKKEFEAITINKNERLRNEIFESCEVKHTSILKRKLNEMIEYYCYINPEYREILVREYIDINSFKEKYTYILSPDYNFDLKFKEFINELIEYKRKEIKCKNKNDYEPLLFIFIDDIDLKTYKVKELMDSVMQYMNHKNIVCILSGDYNMLRESMTLALLESEKMANSMISIIDDEEKNIFGDYKNIIKRKEYLANEYLKKILPPAFRHNLIKWNENNIPNFKFLYNDESSEGLIAIELKEKLREIFGNENIFFTYNEDEKSYKFYKSFFSIFDKTSRGLLNVLYYMESYDKNFNEKEKFIFIKNLIDTIINSKKELLTFKDTIYSNYIVWGENIETTTLNSNIEEGIECKREIVILIYIIKSLYNQDFYIEDIEIFFDGLDDIIKKIDITKFESYILAKKYKINNRIDFRNNILKLADIQKVIIEISFELKNLDVIYIIKFIDRLSEKILNLNNKKYNDIVYKKLIIETLIEILDEKSVSFMIRKNELFKKTFNLIFEFKELDKSRIKTKYLINNLIEKENINKNMKKIFIGYIKYMYIEYMNIESDSFFDEENLNKILEDDNLNKFFENIFEGYLNTYLDKIFNNKLEYNKVKEELEQKIDKLNSINKINENYISYLEKKYDDNLKGILEKYSVFDYKNIELENDKVDEKINDVLRAYSGQTSIFKEKVQSKIKALLDFRYNSLDVVDIFYIIYLCEELIKNTRIVYGYSACYKFINSIFEDFKYEYYVERELIRYEEEEEEYNISRKNKKTIKLKSFIKQLEQYSVLLDIMDDEYRNLKEVDFEAFNIILDKANENAVEIERLIDEEFDLENY